VAFSSHVRRIDLARGDDARDLPGFTGGMSVLVAGTLAHTTEFEDGRRHITAFSFPGEAVTLGGLVPEAASIKAVGESVLYHMSRSELAGFVDDHPAAQEVVAGLAWDVSRRLIEQMALLGQFGALERVAAFVADVAARIGVTAGGGVALALPMGRGEIADHLGMNLETVSRQFARLKRDGLIRMQSPSRLTVPDLDALRGRLPSLIEDRVPN
jgi:CRP/FNR family transcriptional regulator